MFEEWVKRDAMSRLFLMNTVQPIAVNKFEDCSILRNLL